MTRRDLQNDMKKQGHRGALAKDSIESGPWPHRHCDVPGVLQAAISLTVNGTPRQASVISKLIWNVAENHRAPVSGLDAGAGRPSLCTGTPGRRGCPWYVATRCTAMLMAWLT